MQLRTRWAVATRPAAGEVASLAERLSVPETLAQLLIQRGFADPVAARAFLRPSLADLSDPHLLPDMDRAVDAIAGAVRAERAILVHGDYDVDGQCATALLTRVLREAGARVVPFIPNRMRDGYDLGPAGVAAARAAGADLIVTCDCGTTARAAVADARAAGLGVVVTDHHLPGELPAANAVVNPRRLDNVSPATELCGTGVVFKLVQALVPALGLPEHLPYHFLDLVAMATVADVVPLTGENRILTRFGLRKLADTRWPGVRALIDAAGLKGTDIRAGHVGFVLGPRLNAAGRIGDAMDGLALLLEDDPAEARRRAARLETLNVQRQRLDKEILEQAIGAIEDAVDLERDYGLVLAREGWHAGVIGIVASRLVERYARPAILIALEGDEGKGSGRSIPAFDLHAGLMSCAPHLARFGGHRMAAGLTVERGQLPAFREAFNTAVRASLSADDLVPTQRIDALVRLGEMDEGLLRLLRHLEPCGPGNPGPVFAVSRGRGFGARTVGRNHLRFTLTDDEGARLAAIGFDWADRVPPAWWSGPVDVAFKLDRNEYRGVVSLQARIVGLQPSD